MGDHEWLWEILIYSVYKCLGIYGLWSVMFASAMATGLIIRIGLKIKGVSEEMSCATGGVALMMLMGWIKPWPQAGVYVCFAFYLLLSLRGKWTWKEALAVSLLAVVWMNIHASAL